MKVCIRLIAQTVVLKDIHELFMDTGLDVTVILLSDRVMCRRYCQPKPRTEEVCLRRRQVYQKYKYRREEAERKLKGVEENLVRISDITTELEGQRGPLKTSVGKSEKVFDIL